MTGGRPSCGRITPLLITIEAIDDARFLFGPLWRESDTLSNQRRLRQLEINRNIYKRYLSNITEVAE